MSLVVVHGDILSDDAEALVNPVNVVGHMGKGLALAFRRRFPENYKFYREAAESGVLEVGRVLLYERTGPGEQLALREASATVRPARYIVNFPTKKHWRGQSRLEYIDTGLSDLRSVVVTHGIQSIAIPALGCGLGGLDWVIVRPLIERHAHGLDADVRVYAP